MVLTPRAEATRDRARSAVHEARAVLQPSTDTLKVESLERLFTIRANDGFVVAFGPMLIAAVASVAPGSVSASLPNLKNVALFTGGLSTRRSACRATWGLKYGCKGSFRIGLLARCARDIRCLHSLRSALTIMLHGAM